MTTLLEMVHAINQQLDEAEVPHAIGGALALAYCIGAPRATADVDVNVFLPPERVDQLLVALPSDIRCEDSDRELLLRDGQARLWWDNTPIDIFLSTTEYHDAAATRVRREDLAGRMIPFLSCDDLAVFKAFFDRGKDWVDLGEMLRAGSFDIDRVLGVLARYLGPDDPRITKLIEMASSLGAGKERAGDPTPEI